MPGRKLIVLLVILLAVCVVDAQSDAPLEIITPENAARLELLTSVEPQRIFAPPAPAPVREGDDVLVYASAIESPYRLPLPDDLSADKSPGRATWSPDKRTVSVIFSSDSEDTDAMIAFWRVETSPLLLFTFPATPNTPLAWRPDSRQFALNTRVYDAETGKLAFTHHVEARSDTNMCDGVVFDENPYMAWSADSTRYSALAFGVCASSYAGYGMFDAKDGTLLFELSHSTIDLFWKKLSWSPDGSKLTDGVRSWSTRDGSWLGELNYAHNAMSYPSSLWTPDGSALISSMDSDIVLSEPRMRIYKWDAGSGQTLFDIGLWQAGYVEAVQDDTFTVISGLYRLTLDLTTGEVKTADLLSTSQSMIDALAWSPDSTRFVTISSGVSAPSMSLWQRDNLLSSAAPEPEWRANVDWFSAEAQLAKYLSSGFNAFWPDNDSFVTVTRPWYTFQNFFGIERWNASDGTSDTRLYTSEGSSAEMAVASPDLALAIFGRDKSAHIFDATGQETAALSSEVVPDISGATWSPSGRWLAAYNYDSVAFWNIEQPEIAPVTIASSYTTAVAWHPDERYAAIAAYDKVIVYDPANRAEYAVIPADYASDVAWNIDGSVLVVAMTDTLLLWDVAARRDIVRIPLKNAGTVRFSPDGQLIGIVQNRDTITLRGIPAR